MSPTPSNRSGSEGRVDAAVLVTGPSCRNDPTGAVVVVSETQCETIHTSNPNPPTDGLQQQGSTGRFMNFLGSFVGDSSNNSNTKHGGSPVELEDMAGRKKSSTATNSHVGGPDSGDFDVCREFNYTATDDDDADAPSLISDLTAVKNDDKDGAAGESSSLSIYVAGKSYHPARDYNARRQDELSLFWFTYRCDFPEIAPYGLRSDAGWGCSLRAAQMLLGQALRLHYKSRSWRCPQHFSARRKDPFIRSILTWFADFPSVNQCYYSLHNMVAAGLKYDKLPGEWYGPAAACHVVKDLVEMHERQQQLSNPSTAARIFRVHVAPQGTVYRDAIQDLMTRESRAKLAQETEKKHKINPQAHPLDLDWEEELVESVGTVEWDTGLLLLIPARLGLDSFNEDYVRAVAHTFSFPQSVGVLGGRVRGARWFFGAVSDGSRVFGLDPHTVQNAPRSRTARVNGKITNTLDLTDDYLRSVHTTYPECLSLQKMDPSIAFGFYCRDQEDLENLLASVQKWKDSNPGQPEVFSVADNAPNYASGISSYMMAGSGSLLDADDDDDDGSRAGADDDFVML